MFGWGERNFYLQTPSWSDLDLSVAARALIYGRRTLLHVDHVHDPRPGPDMRPVTISEGQYALLARRIDAYFDLDPYGVTRPLKGYGASDVFYEAHGYYSIDRTCNEWTGRQLRSIGIRIGRWTPFSASVMYKSEEHTSELQSLMRISYAVFCLKKKKKSTQQRNSLITH